MKKQYSLKTALFKIVFLSLLLLTCLAIAMNYFTIKKYNSMLMDEISKNSEISARLIDDIADQIKSTGDVLSSNNEIQNYMASRKVRVMTAQEYTFLNNSINNIYFSRRNESCIRFVNLVDETFQAGTYLQGLKDLSPQTLTEISAMAAAKKGAVSFYLSESEAYPVLAVKSILKIDDLSLDNLGTLIIGVDLDKIMRRIATRATQTGAVQLLHTQDGILIYESVEGFSTVPLLQNNQGLMQYQGETYIKVTTKISSTGWLYTALVPANGILQPRNYYLSIFAIICTTCFLMIFGIAQKLVKNLFRGFDNLLINMRNGKVEFEIDKSTEKQLTSIKEMEQLYNQFYTMADKINDLIYQNYQMDLTANTYKIKALSSQINPHFLYNTLNTIYWKAMSTNSAYIAEMVEPLGKILHKTLSDQSFFFTVADELGIVEQFLTIQNLRYGEAVTFKQEIDPNSFDCFIPRLSLQPLIENAIQEAMRDIEQRCNIFLSIQVRNERVNIRIANTGSQFPDDFSYKFYKNELSPQGFGIGLKNIEQRLQLCYGNRFSMLFYNENKRAVVELSIPVHRKEGVTC